MVIDPGKTGAAVILEGCQPLEGYAMQSQNFGIDVGSLRDTLLEWQGLYGWEDVWLEMPTPRPRQGCHQTAVQFYIVGQTIASLYGIGTTVYELNPSTWTAFTKRLSRDPGADSKKQAQELCHRYFPEFARGWIPKTKIHDGVADCLAISLYVNRDTYVDDIGGDYE